MKVIVLLALTAVITVAGMFYGFDELWLTAISATFAIVGAVIARRRPENPIGWLYMIFGLVAAIDYATFVYAETEQTGANVAASISAHLWHASFGLFIYSLLVFPTGRLLSPRWRWAAGALVVVAVVLLVSGIFEASYLTTQMGLPHVKPLFAGAVQRVSDYVFAAGRLATVAMVVLAGICLVLRLARSRGEERQQMKVFVYTVACVMFAFPVILAITGQGEGVVLLPLIPISAAVAILKYRLYDIDVVIKRTLVYGALTATLGAAYLASVLILQLLLSPTSDLAIAGSTLAVAALFRPVRARVQQIVNRRFYRSQYDAQRTIETFGARLRNQVSLEALSEELRGVTRDTLQPAHVTLWLVRR